MLDENLPVNPLEARKLEAERYLKRLRKAQEIRRARTERSIEAGEMAAQAYGQEAKSYIDKRAGREKWRAFMRSRSLEDKNTQEEALRQQAEVYRQRLRKFLPLKPQQNEES